MIDAGETCDPPGSCPTSCDDGVVCTSDVRETRPRAIDLIGDRKKGRIYTVGRLDEETIGLVLLTNDGEFANRISHPRYGVEKTYRVVVVGWVRDEMLAKLRDGVRLSDFRSNFSHVKLVKRSRHTHTHTRAVECCLLRPVRPGVSVNTHIIITETAGSLSQLSNL